MIWKKALGLVVTLELALESGFRTELPDVLSSLLAPEAEARSQTRIFLRRPSSLSRSLKRKSSRTQAAAVGDVGDRVRQIPGFSGLAQKKNALLEADRRNPFVFRKLFIDPRTGALLGATRAETIRQAREFYLKNLDKFKGNDRALIQNFLLANGAAPALSGQLRVDMLTGTAPKFESMKDRDVRIAALNFLLNSISQTSRLLRVRQIGADGTVGINTRGVMRSAALALLVNDNPYACGRNVPPRLDFLIHRAMDSKTYNQLLQIESLEGETEKIGVQDDKKRTSGNKIVISAPPGAERESIVGIAPERTLEVQGQRRRPGLDWFISWDTFGNATPGVETESRNPFVAGINFTHDASEAIWHKSNGFLQFGLFNAAGAAQTEAPSSIALGRNFDGRNHNIGETVKTPVNCLICHSNGFRGGGKQGTGEPYTDNTLGIDPKGNRIGSRIPSFHRGFFTTNAAYFARAERASAIFLNAMKRSGSYVPLDGNPNKAAPLLPDFVDEYLQPVTFTQAAKELGTTEGALQALFGRKDGKFERKAFEKSFCSIQRRVGTDSVLGPDTRRLKPGDPH